MPQIDPAYKIHVEADTYASAQRGGYDVLAFEGNCVLRQGQLTAKANEIVLWIERNTMLNTQHAGKVICYINGEASLDWGNGRTLKDWRYTGRLFSVHPVAIDRGRKVIRYDIPNLDWEREPGKFSLAQFANGQTNPSSTVFEAPPLLDSKLPNAPNTSTSAIPPMTGGVDWDPNAKAGSTSQGMLPQGGLAIPQNGSRPYPASGLPESVAAEELAPSLPPAQQTVLQAPKPDSFQVKSVQFLPRDRTPLNITFNNFDEARGESVFQIRGGFKLAVQGVQVAQQDGSMKDYGSVSLEADNAVVWVRSDGPINPLELGSSSAERPIELYLDGNIVFYQGNRVIYANRMYYNVSSEYGMVLNAEVLTPVPQYQGLLRLKADVLQQRDSRSFKAFGAAMTSSRLGVPRYWVQAREVDFQDNRDENELSVFSNFGEDRPTAMRATARGNHAYVAGIPVFYWPTLNTDLQESSFYLRSLRLKNDTIFGFQAYADWDLYQLLGIDGPEGTNWQLSTDYLSDRGIAFGTKFDYNRPTILFGAPGHGFSDSWFIKDNGFDTIGIDRAKLTPEEEIRGRAFSRHRIFLTPNWELIGETGWISDRNFLEQYFENEWEQEKDFNTELRLRRYNGNRMFEAFGSPRINDFFAKTEWLPRLNHFLLGQDLFGQRVTWSSNTSVGYGHQRVATTPIDAQDAAKFSVLPWETDSEGVRAVTRQELSLPFSLGAFKLVPFLSGEAGFWNEDAMQNDVVRLTGQAGVRGALPMWNVNPNVENRLLDLRGLAHKATLETEFFYADSSEDYDRFPLYDPLDDDAQEHFRRRFLFNTFGGTLPPQFDERRYALRSGMQRWVTASSSEIVDDMSQLRVSLKNRWQTKRGVPGRERIVDLMSLDTSFVFFPKADRDNFGEEIGAATYDFRYHIGDRVTLLSDGYFDVFSQGLKVLSAGAQMSRPGRGDVYIGMLSIEGPISANILNGYLNYRMNDKWIATGGAAFDFGDTGSIGQSLALTRIGESALIRVGINVDHGRDNVSFNFNIEPRFLQSGRLGALGGELVPPAGLFGVE
ncbi:MAG: organic solvent tolerance protein OstA [Planctomycetota bacterium]